MLNTANTTIFMTPRLIHFLLLINALFKKNCRSHQTQKIGTYVKLCKLKMMVFVLLSDSVCSMKTI